MTLGYHSTGRCREGPQHLCAAAKQQQLAQKTNVATGLYEGKMSRKQKWTGTAKDPWQFTFGKLWL